MDQTAHQIRSQQWLQIITECNNSGLTKKEWRRQNNVSEKSFYYYQKKLRA